MADQAWGLGFVLLAWFGYFCNPSSFTGLLVNLLISLWGARLFIHIYFRHLHKEEDFRYRKMKEQWRTQTPLKVYVNVFLLQAAILYIIASPILWIHTHPSPLFWPATLIWVIGFFIETIADVQLFRFQQNPANQGKLLQTGLWNYSRHPNYLGEILQWWAIWGLTLPLPNSWIFCISPVLLTFLIVKVSGIAPLEEKMKNNPDFVTYAKKTPTLIPQSLANGGLYMLSWFLIVYYGAKGSFWIPFASFLAAATLQIRLFCKSDPLSYSLFLPLGIYGFLLGLFQEMLFIHLNLLLYPGQGFFPPFWLLSLYFLFSLTLNSSLQFLNRSITFCFILGGVGALLSYLTGEKLRAVDILNPISYPFLLLSWGFYLSLLIVLNRKLLILYKKYTSPIRLNELLTVFFDKNCPVCSREMRILKTRTQTGKICYACPESDKELGSYTDRLTISQSMAKIHAIEENGTILTGTDALSELYARTDLLLLAVLLQAPGLRIIFKIGYAIWAKARNGFLRT
ncbi:MAG: DUF2878 family protein [Parachlamydiales bacterium]|nr:DUF2878 family protein [Parachlamydiales bacterium]